MCTLRQYILSVPINLFAYLYSMIQLKKNVTKGADFFFFLWKEQKTCGRAICADLIGHSSLNTLSFLAMASGLNILLSQPQPKENTQVIILEGLERLKAAEVGQGTGSFHYESLALFNAYLCACVSLIIL